jgi:hypothetical protein
MAISLQHNPGRASEPLEQFSSMLQANDLPIILAKCVFAASSLVFLGNIVRRASVMPLPHRIEVVKAFPRPQDFMGLRGFSDLLNFLLFSFLELLANYNSHQLPLRQAKCLVRTGTTGAGFLAAKATLAAVLQLVHPSQSAALALKVDTSRLHTGAVLQQMRGVDW